MLISNKDYKKGQGIIKVGLSLGIMYVCKNVMTVPPPSRMSRLYLNFSWTDIFPAGTHADWHSIMLRKIFKTWQTMSAVDCDTKMVQFTISENASHDAKERKHYRQYVMCVQAWRSSEVSVSTTVISVSYSTSTSGLISPRGQATLSCISLGFHSTD